MAEMISTNESVRASNGADEQPHSDSEPPRGAPTDPPTRSPSRDVVFIHSDAYYRALARLPVHPRREEMTLALLRALARQQHAHADDDSDNEESSEAHTRPFGMQLIAPTRATEDQLLRFHARDYVDTLRRTEQASSSRPATMGTGASSRHGRPVSDKDCEEFKLVDDAYVFPGLYEYCCFVAGASLTAADALRHLITQWRKHAQDDGAARQAAPVAINLGGGRHHAMRSQASGFCYVNDVVLAIQRLLCPPASTDDEKIERVLCVDMDVHHGDGVQEAFYFSANVTTVSFHLFERAFFPGTGSEEEVGVGRGKNHSVNVPLRRGIVDTQFHGIFETIVAKAINRVDPQAVVLVCGVDTLARDGLGGFNLTSSGIAKSVTSLVGHNRPLLLLGGGGYSGADAVRALAAVVAAVAAPEVDTQAMEVPEHDFYEEYSPDFRMGTKAVIHRPNENTEEYLALVSDKAVAILERAKHCRFSRIGNREDSKRKRG